MFCYYRPIIKRISTAKTENKLLKKSFVNINLSTLNLNNKTFIQRLLMKAQAEIKQLKRKHRIQQKKMYRLCQKVRNTESLVNHIQRKKLITGTISKLLQVSN